MPNRLSVVLFSILALCLAACGSVATPVPGAQTLQAQQTTTAIEAAAEAAEEDVTVADEETQQEAVAAQPTEIPPTATFTPQPPTATPTEVLPTATTQPTEAPAAQPQTSTDQVAQLASLLGDPTQGETIFNSSYTTAIGDWACSLCHNVNVPDRLIGPSLLGIPQHAGQRVEGQVAQRYIWNSIIAPQEYIVEGYADGAQMPPNYREIFSDDELYHLIAYLMTLEE